MQNQLLRLVAAFLCIISLVATTRAAVAAWTPNTQVPTLTVQAPEFACLTSKRNVSGMFRLKISLFHPRKSLRYVLATFSRFLSVKPIDKECDKIKSCCAVILNPFISFFHRFTQCWTGH
jgi:hypothetical protein